MRLQNWGRLRTLALLFVLVASLYMTTYSANIESGDARRLFDTVSSVVDHGDLLLDLSAWQFPPQNFDPTNPLPLQSGNIEPLQIVAAVPLYLLAKVTPLGLVQTVYLLNVIVGALAACILYGYAITLGYRERTAILTAILFAACTLMWVYSKSFFREPLMLLMMLTAALIIERLRLKGYRSIPLLIALVVTLIAAILTKASAAMGFPALLILALPNVRGVSWRRVIFGGGLILALIVAVFVGLAIYGAAAGLGGRYNVCLLYTSPSPRD